MILQNSQQYIIKRIILAVTLSRHGKWVLAPFSVTSHFFRSPLLPSLIPPPLPSFLFTPRSFFLLSPFMCSYPLSNPSTWIPHFFFPNLHQLIFLSACLFRPPSIFSTRALCLSLSHPSLSCITFLRSPYFLHSTPFTNPSSPKN